MKRVALGLIALAMAVTPAPSAMATSITGQAGGGGVDMFTSTGITFINPGIVFATTDGLSPLNLQFINFTSFNFATAAGTTWFDFTNGTTTIDFSLLTAMTVPAPAGFQNVVGTGVLTETGFDPTDYILKITSNSTAAQTTYAFTLAPAAAVPEPATLFLLGSGLLGLAVLLFRRAKKPNSAVPC